jgi:hypothetical protein
MRTPTTLMIALASAALFARAAAAVTIPELLADPQAFDQQSIVLTGDVEAAVPVGGESGYNLRGGAAVITVVSRNAAPAVGSHLAVTGTVRAFKEDDEGTLPPVFFESSRSVLP